jgi:4-amino-4-deoxy-L-arabinose transferase-like glycosyltransferase
MTMNRSLIIVLIFYGCVLLAGIGSWGVIETSEARYAEIAREMVRSGDWIHPTLLNIHHYHKPPLTYWITAVGYTIFGINETGARFFLVLAFLVQIILVYRIAIILLTDENQALQACVIYAALPLVLTSVRGVTTDAYLNTFVLASVLCWMLRRTKDQVVWIYLFAMFLGFAFFTKGPVGLVIPVLIMIGMRGIFPKRKIFISYHQILAALIFIVIAISWFALLVIEDGRYVDYFLFRHTFERFTHAEVFTRTQPWWYYLCFGTLLTFPWLAVILFTQASAWKTFPLSIRRIAIFWVLIPLLFFSLASSKLVLYVLPLCGGISILITVCLNTLGRQLPKFENTVFYFIIFLLCSITILLIYIKSSSPVWLPWLTLPAAAALLFLKLNGSLQAKTKIVSYSLCWSGFLIVFSTCLFSTNELTVNGTAPIAEWIVQHHMNNRQVMVYNKLLPSLSFHLDREIISLNDGNRYLDREVQFETDASWKNTLYDLRNPDDLIRLKHALKVPTVMISKRDIGQNAAWMKEELKNSVSLGDWNIFYN